MNYCMVNCSLQTWIFVVCHPKIIFQFWSNIYAFTPVDFQRYVDSSGVQDDTHDLNKIFLLQNSLWINRSLPT